MHNGDSPCSIGTVPVVHYAIGAPQNALRWHLAHIPPRQTGGKIPVAVKVLAELLPGFLGVDKAYAHAFAYEVRYNPKERLFGLALSFRNFSVIVSPAVGFKVSF